MRVECTCVSTPAGVLLDFNIPNILTLQKKSVNMPERQEFI